MPSLDRPLQGEVLRFRLGEEPRATERRSREEHLKSCDEDILARSGRSARTLVKNGPLRVTLITLAAGGTIPEHHVDGPITVHVLRGTIRFRVAEEEHVLEPGDLLSLDGGVPHSVHSETGGAFLLTVASPAR